MNNTVF